MDSLYESSRFTVEPCPRGGAVATNQATGATFTLPADALARFNACRTPDPWQSIKIADAYLEAFEGAAEFCRCRSAGAAAPLPTQITAPL